MSIYRILFCIIILSSCSTLDSFYQNVEIPPRPAEGFDRKFLFPIYFDKINPYSTLRTRDNWIPQEKNFKSLYPSFDIDLLSFNNLGGRNDFSWQERLIFADALELIVFVINHPLFEEEMRETIFYNNSGTSIVSSSEVVRVLRASSLYITLGKDTLEENVLAVATLGGSSHTIWFRNDVDYQKYSVLDLAVIFGHELTHNIGFVHASNVPYGMHDPIKNVINRASEKGARDFINNTPYYEDDFLTRVRSAPRLRSRSKNIIIHKDYIDDFF